MKDTAHASLPPFIYNVCGHRYMYMYMTVHNRYMYLDPS